DRANYRRFKIKTVQGQDDFASVAEVVRRRYTRLLKESGVATPQPEEGSPDSGPQPEEEVGETKVAEPIKSERGPDSDAGGAVPQELQRVVDDVSAAMQGRGLHPISGDAAAGDVKAGRASGSRATKATPNLPDLILIDGGKGQLGAACAELDKLGLSRIPIIGLAKEFEEVYRPGIKEPLRLSHDSGALKLLQRVRDESHRLANTYNATLRLRRISESILDEFPSIGERRKAALLKKFGSVQRIRLATVEQIAEVPGFGGKAAAELKTFLDARSVSEI
ncbi:MAG TPA: helix-hairpin-helix domain-containing protein, partial [Candidatus Dormibacteraeota bacterium]|nr:helix-hairpin-helix domain-containing protein [Candidatus Dormibacteraeota bacterium]